MERVESSESKSHGWKQTSTSKQASLDTWDAPISNYEKLEDSFTRELNPRNWDTEPDWNSSTKPKALDNWNKTGNLKLEKERIHTQKSGESGWDTTILKKQQYREKPKKDAFGGWENSNNKNRVEVGWQQNNNGQDIMKLGIPGWDFPLDAKPKSNNSTNNWDAPRSQPKMFSKEWNLQQFGNQTKTEVKVKPGWGEPGPQDLDSEGDWRQGGEDSDFETSHSASKEAAPISKWDTPIHEKVVKRPLWCGDFDYDIFKSDNSPELQVTLADRWRILRKLDSGGFSDVYLGQELTSGFQVAIKRELEESNNSHMTKEYKVYQVLGTRHFLPKIHYFGSENGYRVMVMDLLGPSLRSLTPPSGYSFRLQSILELGVQMVQIMEAIHNKEFVYRDAKPHNFLLSLSATDSDLNLNLTAMDYFFYPLGPKHEPNHDEPYEGSWRPEVKLIDFGLTKLESSMPRPSSKANSKRRPKVGIKALTGTPKYASLAVHQGHVPTYWDDLESIAYMLIEMLLGSIPSRPFPKTRGRHTLTFWEVYNKVKTHLLEDFGNTLPFPIVDYIRICRSKGRKVDYERLINVLK